MPFFMFVELVVEVKRHVEPLKRCLKLEIKLEEVRKVPFQRETLQEPYYYLQSLDFGFFLTYLVMKKAVLGG